MVGAHEMVCHGVDEMIEILGEMEVSFRSKCWDDMGRCGNRLDCGEVNVFG